MFKINALLTIVWAKILSNNTYPVHCLHPRVNNPELLFYITVVMIAKIIFPSVSPFYNVYAGIKTTFTLPYNPLSFDIQQGHCLDFTGNHSSP